MREEYLFQREVALLPSTQQYAENTLRGREILKQNRELQARKDELYKLLHDVNTQIRENSDAAYQLMNHTATAEHQKDTPQFVGRCPKECLGFISVSDYKCGICAAKICKKCTLVIENDDHECDPSDIETAKLLKKDSKPCPKCAALIFKIDGCDQMWCTQCHTAFSWKTNVIVTGRVHNPHFYEWQRQSNGGVAPRVEDNPNGDCQNHTPFSIVSTHIGREDYKISRRLGSFHGLVGHVSDEFPRLTESNHLDIRVSYLLKEISEDDFKKRIYSSDIAYNRSKDLRDVVDVLVTESENIFAAFRHIQGYTTRDYLLEVCNKIDQLIEFINSTMSFVFKKYSTVSRRRIYFSHLNQYVYDSKKIATSDPE